MLKTFNKLTKLPPSSSLDDCSITAAPIRMLCREMAWSIDGAQPTRLLSAEGVARNPRAKALLRAALASVVGQDWPEMRREWSAKETGVYVGLVMGLLGFDTVQRPNGDRWLPDEMLNEWRILHTLASQPDVLRLLSELEESRLQRQ